MPRVAYGTGGRVVEGARLESV